MKYFGTDDVIGKSLPVEEEGNLVDFTVTGILKEVPENSHIQFDMLMSIATYPNELFADMRSNYLYTYVLVNENTKKQALEDRLKTFVEQRLEPVYGDLTGQRLGIHEVLKVQLFPITDIHLHPCVNWELEPGGNINSVYIFSTVAVFILIIACINFINLSTALASKRAKEVSLRKTIGANKSHLRAQFILESVLSAFFSLGVAFVLCLQFFPVFNQIISADLSITSLLRLDNLILLIGTTFVVGILSGLYPAFYLTKFDPARILKGGLHSGRGKSIFRKNMVVFQFVISTILIIGMITIYKQMSYIQNRSLGFDKENLVVIPAISQQTSQNYKTFRTELLQNSQIVSVTASSDLPGDPVYGNSSVFNRQVSDEPINLINMSSDYDYVDTLKMKILAGRGFSREFGTDAYGSILLNEAAVKRIGWTPVEAIGKELDRGNQDRVYRVIGVVQDFNYKSLRSEVEPAVIWLNPDQISMISVRILPSETRDTLAFIQQKWESTFPGERFEYSFLDSRFNQLYERERKMLNIFVVFTSLSILVACLGLFGLATFTVEVKTKEIGVRKVLGASASSVVWLLSKEFVKWIILAFIVACPLVWILMNWWLQNFAYRTSLGWEIFLLAGSITLFMTVFTFISQSLKAANANPVESLRHE